MRAVDLAVYADTLAAEAAMLSRRLERARRRSRQNAIEREARDDLSPDTVGLLERLGVFERGAPDPPAGEELGEIGRSLTAVEELQAWVESRLAALRAGQAVSPSGRGEEPMRPA